MPSDRVKGLGTSTDMASALLFRCSDESSFVTGQTVAVDGGTFRRPERGGSECWPDSNR